jgi:hypothetical protein
MDEIMLAIKYEKQSLAMEDFLECCSRVHQSKIVLCLIRS